MNSFFLEALLLCTMSRTDPVEQKNPQEIMDAWAQSGVQDPMFSRVVMALLAVIALIFVTLYILKRFFKIGGKGTRGTRLRIIDSLPLGGKRMIQVLKVFDRTMVIGVTGDRIDLLTELSEEEVPAPSQGDQGERRVFGNILPLRARKEGLKKAGGKGIES